MVLKLLEFIVSKKDACGRDDPLMDTVIWRNLTYIPGCIRQGE